MSNTTTITLKTNADTKKQAQEFFSSLWLNLSVAINLFLNDVVRNKRFAFEFQEEEPFGTLYPINYEDLSEASKKAYHEVENMNEEDFIVYTRENVH